MNFKQILPLVALLGATYACAQTYQLTPGTRCAYASYAITCQPEIPDVSSSVFFGFRNGNYNTQASPVTAYLAYEASKPTTLYADDFYPSYSGILNPPTINYFQCSPDPSTGGCTKASTLYLSYSDLVNSTTTSVTLQYQQQSAHCGGKGTQNCLQWFWIIVNGQYTMGLPTEQSVPTKQGVAPEWDNGIFVDGCGVFANPTGRLWNNVPQWSNYCYVSGLSYQRYCTWFGFPWDPNGGFDLYCD